MKHNLRLILILIVAASICITVVLGSWLYGSYHQRMGLFLSLAERTMFDAIQETVQQVTVPTSTMDNSTAGGGIPRHAVGEPLPPFFARRLATAITDRFPAIEEAALVSLLDSLESQGFARMRTLRRFAEAPPSPRRAPRGIIHAMDGEKDNRPRQLLPHFLFGQVAFDSLVFETIERTFADGLQGLGVYTDFTFQVIEGDTASGHFRPGSANEGLVIRPILIDPERVRFIAVSFDHPWQYLLYSLSWQLVVSVVLVVTLVGCFVYLFHMIFKQDKLALLRRAFVNNMTHELRTPVATVSAAIQALQHYTDREDAERRDKYLSISKEELDHLSTLIDNVLRIAESDQTSLKRLNCQTLDFAVVVKRCVEKSRVHHQDKSILFSLDCPDSGVTVFGDGEHLRNVVTNLLDNAAKFGSKHVHVVLRIMALDPKFAELQVNDDGIGIPENYQTRIFEPFFRVPEGDLYHVKGSGLGLPYVKQVIAQHGGTVSVASKPGQGARFISRIPISRNDD